MKLTNIFKSNQKSYLPILESCLPEICNKFYLLVKNLITCSTFLSGGKIG